MSTIHNIKRKLGTIIQDHQHIIENNYILYTHFNNVHRIQHRQMGNVTAVPY